MLRTETPPVRGTIALPSPAMLAAFSKFSRYALAFALVLSAAVLSHYFFRTAGKAPFLAVDDALANIYVHLANRGSFGFPASPVQGMTGAPRLEGFFNYGPIPFLLGASLDWLFGSSYVVARSLHPIVVLALCLAAIACFRRSIAAAASFCLLALAFFAFSSWPMVRPDIVVAGLGVCGVAAQTMAARSGRARYWCAAGFCVAGAVTSHQISWALAPALLLFWAVASWLGPARSIRRSLLSLASISAGVAAALLLYAVAIEWRFAEVFELFRAYGEFVGKGGTFAETLGRHLNLAFSAAPAFVVWPVAVAIALSSAFSALWAARLGRKAFPLLAWTLPSLLTLGAYAASLGTYANFHSGYALLLQLGSCWAAAAFLAALKDWAPGGRGELIAAADAGLALALSAVLASSAVAAVRTPPSWVTVAREMVDIDDYLDEVIRPIPVGASTWGGIIFGLQSGTRLDLMQFIDAASLVSDFTPEARTLLAPEFLIINDLLKSVVLDRVSGAGTGGHVSATLGSFHEHFPGQRYVLAGLVDAPPYGTTLVFKRTDQAAPIDPPMIAAANGAGPQWGRRLGPPIPVVFESDSPVEFDVTFGSRAEGRATRTRSAYLPPGVYLATIGLENAGEHDVGLIVGTSAPRFKEEVIDVAFNMAQTIYFGYSKEAHLLVRHPGGRLYISQLDSGEDADFHVASLRRLDMLEPSETPVSVPPISEWTVTATGGVATAEPEGISVKGDDTQFGYQLMSGPIPVQPGNRYILRAALEVMSGSIAVGILDETGQWLVAPVDLSGLVNFSSGRNRSITIVIANNQAASLTKSRFHLLDVSLGQRFAPGGYIKSLIRCRSERHAETRPPECR